MKKFMKNFSYSVSQLLPRHCNILVKAIVCTALAGGMVTGCDDASSDSGPSEYVDNTGVDYCNENALSDMALAPGSVVKFGHYPNTKDTTSAIEWIVLDVKTEGNDTRYLLMTKYVIDAKAFHSDQSVYTWDKSDIRRYLNDSSKSGFLSSFNACEQGRIVEVTNENPPNPYNANILGGESTKDKVFLLSSGEAEDYFFSRDANEVIKAGEFWMGYPTEYALSQGLSIKRARTTEEYAQGDCPSDCWLLRSPGNSEDLDSMACVGFLGFVSRGYVDDKELGLRPVMWVH